jgi:hypothetical protein
MTATHPRNPGKTGKHQSEGIKQAFNNTEITSSQINS